MKKDLTLVMSFKNADNKDTTITLNHIKDGITKDEISTAMDAVITGNLFTSTGGDLVTKVKAQVIDKTTKEHIM